MHHPNGLYLGEQHTATHRLQYLLTRAALWVLVRTYLRLHVTGRDRLPRGPAVLCFNHQSWTDPFVLCAVLPPRPRLFFFGPKEEDMRRGARNRLMTWSGMAVPYRPGRDDLLSATRRADAILSSGGWLAIAGEGRIHAGESTLLPLLDGPAFFALRAAVPTVPVAVNGTSWLCLGRRVRVRMGEPIATDGRPTRTAVDALTTLARDRLLGLVHDYPDPPVPGPVGRWLTELFNEWPEGSRPA
jgi:1-acyl-sn-glycerol-3-phosphate acyltransferase